MVYRHTAGLGVQLCQCHLLASPFPRAGKLEDQATALKAEQMQHADTKAALGHQAAVAVNLSEDVRERYEANQSCICHASYQHHSICALGDMQQDVQLHVTVIESAGMLQSSASRPVTKLSRWNAMSSRRNMQDYSSTSRSVLATLTATILPRQINYSAVPLDSSVHGNRHAEPIRVACRKATSCSMMPELQSRSTSRPSKA